LLTQGSETPETQESVPQAAVTAAKAAVVRVDVRTAGGRGAGTGFFVDEGLVVTNDHVVAEASSVTLRHEDGTTWDVSGCLVRAPALDLAILAVDGAAPATLSLDTTPSQVFDPAAVIGHPGGSDDQLVSDGRIAALKAEETLPGGAPLLVFTARIAAGNSGSPILGRRGGVVAVAAASTLGLHPSYLAVPASHLPELVARARSARPTTCGPKALDTNWNLIISLAFFAALLGVWWWSGRRKLRRRR